MMTEATANPCETRPLGIASSPHRICSFLFWTLIFGLAYTQAPLYYSNQNQYFLHGLAHAGYGHLNEDWLATTRDPAPVFTAFVSIVTSFLHENLFYVCYVLLFGVYFHSLIRIADRLAGTPLSNRAGLLLATALVVIHAGLLRFASAQLLGVDFPWYFQAGVAGQYLLGFGLQPSTCGVFLLASLSAFLHERHWSAITLACLAAILHATYLLPAAMLVLAYLMVLLRNGRGRDAVLLGLGALVFVAPSVAYAALMFAPTSPEAFSEAQRILAHVRIPHHAEPARWFDAVALGQVLWIVAGVLLMWRRPLFLILVIVFGLSLLLTVAQVISGSDALALLFPWRSSAFLVPLATTIIFAQVARLADRGLSFVAEGNLGMVCGVVLGICVAGGVAIMALGLGYRSNSDEVPLLDWVKSHRDPGETYLLPVEIPKISGGPKGAASTNFTPAPLRGKSGHLIAIDLQRFRLSTGAPIYVDFKAIPYRDGEVLEWQRRLLWAERIYASPDWSAPQLLAELQRERITHVVAPKDRPLRSDFLTAVYEDEAYRLYRIGSEPRP